MRLRLVRRHIALPTLIVICASIAPATPEPDSTPNFGPYNATFLQGGVGVSRQLAADSAVLAAGAPLSITGWLYTTSQETARIVLVGVGDPLTDACRCVVIENGRLALWLGRDQRLSTSVALRPGTWQAIAATYDGKMARLYLDGTQLGEKSLTTTTVAPLLHLAPDSLESAGAQHFGGSLAQLRLYPQAVAPDTIKRLAAARPDFDLIVFHQVGAGWPWQARAWRGLQEPQDPWTLPQQVKAPPSKPVAAPLGTREELRAARNGLWTIGAWRLAEAPNVAADGAHVSSSDYNDESWYAATVPGTVLTTLIDRGIYPDPDYGLNNMAIPESLARQDYWYRSSFVLPAELNDKQLTLTFKGINYAAEVWANGVRLGDIKGAFIRGVFDVTQALKPGQRNVLAVRVSPPPHPGIPHEESIAAGPGENGGNLALDGPTFVASEGWDWIPGIRDRNTGIWQDVELKATGNIRLLDPQVITRLPLPETDHADVSIVVAVDNHHATAASATIEARFEGVRVSKTVTLAPGKSAVRLEPAEFPQLRVTHPRLWWPNGYGEPELYALTLAVNDGAAQSDALSLHFGMRHITYDLSLFDGEGRLRRVEVDFTAGTARGERLIDVSHEAIKKSPKGWAASLTSAGDSSPAVRPAATHIVLPHLAMRVNGVPIAARGGNWGTDDSRKRISRERLEPYFKLHRAANLNTIRNWVGQNTEDVFYDLADEYGLLILNDFWASTQDFQVEPQDPSLFLANASDVISRYRNHPSIALWFGRNEGVPQPVLNEGLEDLVATLDGTRYFNGSSNNVNLQGSGPYNYRPPQQYFTDHALGFSVEVGTPSLSTLEALHASIPEADRWPLSDTIAYHDWHFGGNGDVASFMKSLATQFGAATDLADFERKAQMMNFVTYRALFEGFNAGLWTQNSGRLLWMTHPSWPSNAWQIYSSDYDTHAAYFGVMKACEPVHAQMNLPDLRLAVINTTLEPRTKLKLRSRVVSLDNRLLADRTARVNVAANAVTTLAALDLAPHLAKEELVLVVLSLTDSKGVRLSENTYWQGTGEASNRRLNTLARQSVVVIPRATRAGDQIVITAELENRGSAPALAAKLTLIDERGARVLPAYYSDNYLTLLPGEARRVQIRSAANGAGALKLNLRGWNVEPSSTGVVPAE